METTVHAHVHEHVHDHVNDLRPTPHDHDVLLSRGHGVVTVLVDVLLNVDVIVLGFFGCGRKAALRLCGECLFR